MKNLNLANIVCLFALMFFCLNIKAQDVITLRNGDEIQAKVLEIAPEFIKYKKYIHLDGPTITILKQDVFMIKYESGLKDVFKLEPATEPINADATKPKTPNHSNEIDHSKQAVFTKKEEEPTSTLIIRYPGKKFIMNATIRLFWDVQLVSGGVFKENFTGTEVGRGGFKDGFEVKVNATIGKHGLLLLQGKSGKGRKIWADYINIEKANTTYVATFKYNKMLGLMLLDSVVEQ